VVVEPWDRAPSEPVGQPEGRQDHSYSLGDLRLMQIRCKSGDLAVFYHEEQWWCGTVEEVDGSGDAVSFRLGGNGPYCAFVLREACGTVYVAPASWFKKPLAEMIEAAKDEDTFGGISRHFRPHRRMLGE
jgi:hypothetical protein